MPFDFFCSKLSEVREYRSAMDYWYFLNRYLSQPGCSGSAELISEDETVTYNDHFRSTHLTFPPEPGGLKAVEDAFGITLPDDFIEFYSQWSQVLLVLREAYWIMPAGQIVEINKRWRGPNYDKFPCNLVRFAQYFNESGQHFALRRKRPSSSWTVAVVDDSDYHVDDEDAGTDAQDYRTTDADFTAWLHRMLETDGTPWFPGHDEECKTLRVGYSLGPLPR
jgi:hypothetical protein